MVARAIRNVAEQSGENSARQILAPCDYARTKKSAAEMSERCTPTMAILLAISINLSKLTFHRRF